jgi:Zn-dependent membrane protease YugP
MALCVVVSVFSKIWVKVAWAYYSKRYPFQRQNTGEKTARLILKRGMMEAECSVRQQEDSNWFRHSDDTIALTPEVFSGNSILAICVAAHEAGHALQFARGVTPLTKPKSFSAATNFMVVISAIAVLLALFLNSEVWILVAAICVVTALMTRISLLPIEYGASNIALLELSNIGCYNEAELRKMKHMLRACAFTYVACVFDVLLLIFLLVLAILGSGKK